MKGAIQMIRYKNNVLRTVALSFAVFANTSGASPAELGDAKTGETAIGHLATSGERAVRRRRHPGQ